jgi:hypothetical protein
MTAGPPESRSQRLVRAGDVSALRWLATRHGPLRDSQREGCSRTPDSPPSLSTRSRDRALRFVAIIAGRG